MLLRFLRLSPAHRSLLVEAVVRLAAAQAALRLLPFRAVSLRLGALNAAVRELPSAEDVDCARRVGWAVRTAARRLPWSVVCLPQAMAAQAMLRRRGIATTLQLGLDPADDLRSHAWLRVGDRIVVGGRPDRYTVVSSFALNPRDLKRGSSSGAS